MTSLPETPETFEGRVSDTIRTLQIWCVILTAALVLTIILAAVGFSRSSTATTDATNITRDLKNAVQSPTHGKDIAIWCGFDTSIEADLLSYIGQFHGHVPTLKLPSLNCADIEAGEAASTRAKH